MKFSIPTASIVALFLLVRAPSFAAPTGPIEIPQPAPSAPEAVTLAMKHFKDHKEEDFSIISVQWNTPGHFRPHYSDGVQWDFTNAPQEWSWFITYIVPAKGSRRKATERAKGSNVRVLRIRSNGIIEEPVGIKS